MEITKKDRQNDFLLKSANVLLFIYTALFLLFHSIVAFYIQDWIDRFECAVAALLAVVMIMKLVTLSKEEKLKWFKSSLLVFVYFAVRTANFIETGFNYTVARTVFFEGIYLFVICAMILDSRFCKERIMKLFVIVNFVLNIANVAAYYILLYGNPNSGICTFLREGTYVAKKYVIYSSMYDNSNAFGIMTALAIIIAFSLISKNDTIFRKLMITAYMVFSLYCVLLSECRSAMLSLFVCAVAWAIVTVTKKKITGKMMVIAAFFTALIVTGGVYGFMNMNQNEGLYSYTDAEAAIQEISSSRYYIWKSGYFAHQDNRLLGVGSLKLELDDRNEYVRQYNIDNNYDMSSYANTDLGPHNGYLAMIYCTGLLGFLAFMALFLQKILKAKSLSYGGWYLTVIFFMSVNMFETMTIVSRFFVCLMIFIILEMDNNDKEHGYDLESFDEAKLL